MGKYIIFGAGNVGLKALHIIKSENVSFFIDNDIKKQGKNLCEKSIISLNSFFEKKIDDKIVIAVSDDKYEEIISQLQKNNITNFCTFSEFKYEETKKKLIERIDYLEIYNRAISWIKRNTNRGEGIICNTDLRKTYPEVSGYYIPTLLKWGYRDLAIQYAKYLCKIQHDNGAWYDVEDKNPYIFDTAQILKGLISIREILPEVEKYILKGCNWILSNMTMDGRLVSPLENAWGNEKTFSELIHTYCISPIKDSGEIFDNKIFIDAADKMIIYYTSNCKDEILNFGLLSHFYAYVMEAMIDIGREDLAKEAMAKIKALQKKSGAVPAYNDCDWVCSTGLFQLALVWYRLGDIDSGDKAFDYACKLQNKTGGWYGSYLSEDNSNEKNTYFTDAEISWANKYFLDALYYKNIAMFDKQSYIFCDYIDAEDGRYKCIESIIANYNSKQNKILDAGCGKGRYLRNLTKKITNNKYYAFDLSSKVMKYFDDINIIEKKQGTLTNIPFENRKFDITYACESLEHAIDTKSAIRELFRVTKQGGIVAILDKNKEKLGMFEIEEWEQWFDGDELKEEMLKYCSDVKIIKNISYDKKEADGLFYCWIGIKK